MRGGEELGVIGVGGGRPGESCERRGSGYRQAGFYLCLPAAPSRHTVSL